MDLPYEKDFQRFLLTRLREVPHSWWVKINDRTTIGLPDILGCVAGVFVALELKTKSKVTALQAYTLKKIGAANGQAFVVTPDNYREVLRHLEKIAKLAPSTAL